MRSFNPRLVLPTADLEVSIFVLGISSFSLIALVLSTTQFTPGAAAVAILAWVAVIWVLIFCIKGRFEWVVMAWIVLFPYTYYFFSFPKDHPILTVDRAFLVLVLLVLVNVRHQQWLVPLSSDIKVAGSLWLLYIITCLSSLFDHPVLSNLGSYRLMLDGIVLPPLLGLYAIRCFPAVPNLQKLHACICVLMLGLALVAGTEIVSGTNLFPWTGSVEGWVQSGTFRILRVDGPFESSGVLCLVGMFGFFFIVYSGRLIGQLRSRKQSFLHQTGMLAALGAAFMPMNRGLFIALLVCGCLDLLAESPLIARRIWMGIFGGLLSVAMLARLLYPSVFEDRVTRGDNFYQRIAQNQQTLRVVLDHPVRGVGFNLYHETVQGSSRYSASWHGFEAIDLPHNSMFTVLAEVGVPGLLAYVLAQIFLVRAMWRRRESQPIGWRTFLYCVLAYTIYGLDAGIVYFSDLNLFYIFTIGTILQMQTHATLNGGQADDVCCQ